MSAPQTQQRPEGSRGEGFGTQSDEPRETLDANYTTLSHNHGVALKWAEHGKPVFPCDPTDKRPLTPNGFKNASTDADQVNQWWTERPHAAVGLVTGQASGITVVDVDVKNNQPGLETLQALIRDETGIEQGAVVNTPSGGWHYFFEQPAHEIRGSIGKLPGIDIKADGGYVIAPGSRMANDKDYEPVGDVHHLVPLPAALEAVITASRSHQNPQVSQLPSFSRADVQKAESALAVIDPDCPYDTWTNIGMALHHRFNGDQEGLDIWERWSAGGQKWKGGETTTKWQGFSPDPAAGSPITIQTLYSLAKKDGWQEPVEPLFFVEDGDIGHMLDEPAPPLEYVIRDFLPAEIVGLVAAEGGTGKSSLLLLLAACVAGNMPLFGDNERFQIERPGKVVIIFGEDDHAEVHRRLERILRWIDGRLGADDDTRHRIRENIRSNLLVFSAPGKDVKLTRAMHGEIVVSKNLDRLRETLRQVGEVQMVILDPISRFRAGQENHDDTMNRLVEVAEVIRLDTRATVLLSHHASKASAKESDSSQHAARGHSALVDGVRWMARLRGLSDQEAKNYGVENDDRWQYLNLANAKNNYAKPFPPMYLDRSSGTMKPWWPQKRGKAQEDDDYLRVMPLIEKELRQLARKGEEVTERRLKTEYGGLKNSWNVSRDRLQAILRRGVEEGDLVSTKGTSRGLTVDYLTVPE